MFREQSAHHQEVNDTNCTYAASGIVAPCKRPSCATALAVAQDGQAQSAHHQEVNDANCTYAASGIVTLCK